MHYTKTHKKEQEKDAAAVTQQKHVAVISPHVRRKANFVDVLLYFNPLSRA